MEGGVMSTRAKKRRLRRRLVAAGLLATALTAWTVPVAEAHPTGVYHVAVPAAGNHVRPFHTNPRNRPSFYQQYPNGQVTPIVQTVTKSTDTGFAWGDAGIGAAFAAVAAGLLGAAIQATRTRRSLVTRDPSTRGAA
jgi:hypothetical protein